MVLVKTLFYPVHQRFVIILQNNNASASSSDLVGQQKASSSVAVEPTLGNINVVTRKAIERRQGRLHIDTVLYHQRHITKLSFDLPNQERCPMP